MPILTRPPSNETIYTVSKFRNSINGLHINDINHLYRFDRESVGPDPLRLAVRFTFILQRLPSMALRVDSLEVSLRLDLLLTPPQGLGAFLRYDVINLMSGSYPTATPTTLATAYVPVALEYELPPLDPRPAIAA